MLKNLPIRQRLTLIVLLTTVIVMILMRGASFAFEILVLRKALVSQLSITAKIVASNISGSLVSGNLEETRETLSALRATTDIAAAAVYDSDGRLFATYPDTAARDQFPAQAEQGGYRFVDSTLVGFQAVTRNDKEVGTLYLRLNTRPVISDWIVTSLQLALGVMALVFVVAYLLSWRLQKPIADPIRRLSEAAKAVSERNDYSVQAIKEADDEIGILTDAFNQLLAQIHAQKAALDEHAIVAITDPGGKITYVNDKFCAISKYSREELLGQDHRLVNSGYHSTEFIRGLWVTISAGHVWKGEMRNRAKDGSIYWVDTTIVPFLKPDGKPYQYVAIRGDITQRKQAETQLQEFNQTLERRVEDRTRQLELANKELESFSYSVSHDLRAPLRHIDGYAGLLARSDGDHLTEKGRRHLGNIADSAKQMGALIDDLLVFSRMGRTELKLARVELDPLVDETIDSLVHEINGRRIEWVRHPLPAIAGDRSMLRQVFVNLISNAVKYSRPRDPAVIEVGSLNHSDSEWTIFVKDNGVGFDMEYAHKLFGVFQRLHLAEDFEGTGIGLANVQRIVTRHGGKAWAEAKPDAGATLFFTLPKTERTQS